MRREAYVDKTVFPVTFTRRGWSVRLDYVGRMRGRLCVTARFTPLDPLARDRSLLGDLLSQDDYVTWSRVAAMYVGTLGLPQALVREFSAVDPLWMRSVSSRRKVLRRLVDEARHYVDTELPEVAPVNPDDYLAYIEAGGIAPASLSVIRMLHAGYPSGSSGSSAAGR